MRKRPESISPSDMKALEDPAFLLHLAGRLPAGEVTPDPEDIDRTAPTGSAADQADQHRQAQARKLLRLYGQWKARQK